MSTLSEVRTDLKQLTQKVSELEAESRANAGALAGAIRKTRSQVQQLELAESVRRLRPNVNLVNWQPRAGQPNTPALEDSLLDRLRKGNSVADSIGNVQTFYGIQNLILDPTMENFRYATFATSSVEAVISKSLNSQSAWFVKDGGTSATGSCGTEYLRDDPSDNPFNTAAVRMRLGATGAGTHTLQLRTAPWAAVNFPLLPYLVGAVRVSRLFVNNDTNVTSRKLTLELYDQTSAVVRATTTMDLDLNVPYLTQTQLVTATLFDEAAWSSHSFQLRIRLELVTTGGTGSANFHIGEPQLVMSYSPDVPPYTPLLATYQPKAVHSYGASSGSMWLSSTLDGEAQARYEVDGVGRHYWGPGSSGADLKLERVSTRRLILSPHSTSGQLEFGLQAASGQSAKYESRVAGDSDARVELWGDGNQVALRMGPGNAVPDVNLQRTGASAVRLSKDSSGPMSLVIGDTDSGADLSATALIIGIERAWQFVQGLSGASTELWLQPLAGDKTFNVVDVNGNVVLAVSTVVSPYPTVTAVGQLVAKKALITDNEVVSTVDADQNNYNPTGLATAAIIRFTSFTAARTVTGLTATQTGHRIVLINNTSQSLVLPNESASSTAANRFRCANGASVTVRTQGSVEIIYAGGRWSVLAI